jgi:DNA end-binding protein Ku
MTLTFSQVMAARTLGGAHSEVMPRPMWKGSISFGLVTIPVHAEPASEEKDYKFHQVHEKDGGRVRYRKMCEIDGGEVPSEDIVKGFDIGGGELVMLEDSDFESLPLASAHTVDVVEFVPAEQIDPIMHSRAYYLVPEKAGVKAYSLLRDALQTQDRVGIVKVALRNRERLATLRVYEKVMVLDLLLWPDEVRDPHELKALPEADDKPRAQELTMATQFIESKTQDYDPDDPKFHDDYRAAIKEVIDAKIEGRQVVAAPEPPQGTDKGKPFDLMAALKASVADARKGRGEEPEPEKKAPAKKAGRALKSVPTGDDAPEPKKSAPRKAPAKKTAATTVAKKTAAKKAPAKRARKSA